MAYKNEIVQKFADLLEESRDEFEARKKGQAYKSIFFAVADAFKEDKAKLWNQLVERPIGRNVPSGGAKITQHIEPEETVEVGCKDCPGTGVVKVKKVAPRIFKMGEAGPVKGQESEAAIVVDQPTEDPEPETVPAFLSVEDVMERFGEDPDMMLAFAQREGIKTGKATKAKTIAKKIFEQYGE